MALLAWMSLYPVEQIDFVERVAMTYAAQHDCESAEIKIVRNEDQVEFYAQCTELCE